MEEYKFNVEKSELELLIKALKIGAIYSSDRFEKAKYRYLLGEFEDVLNEKPQIKHLEIKPEDWLKPLSDINVVAIEETIEKKK